MITSQRHNSQQQFLSFYNNSATTQHRQHQCHHVHKLRVRHHQSSHFYQELVFVRKGGAKQPLAQLYEGPYKVICMSGAVVTIQLGNRVEQIATRRCKAAVVDELTTTAADPPRRGRPRKSPTATAAAVPQSSASKRPKRAVRPPNHLGTASSTGGAM